MLKRCPLLSPLVLLIPALAACPSDDSGGSGEDTTSTSQGDATTDADSSEASTGSVSTTESVDTGSSGTDESGSGSSGSAGTTGGAACAPPAELGVYTPSDGDARGFAIRGDVAFVATQAGGMAIVDLTDPSTPTELGTLDFGVGESAFRIDVADDVAYTAMRGDGIRVVDVSDTSTPVELGRDETVEARDVAILGTSLLVVDNTGVVVVDVSDPATPTPVVTDLVLPGSTETIVLDGDIAYVASNGGDMSVVDFSDASSPVVLGGYSPAASADTVWIDGDRAYLPTADGVEIVDIVDPANPSLLGTFERDRCAFAAASGSMLVVLGDDTASTDVPFLSVVDVADPAVSAEQATAFDELDDPMWIGWEEGTLYFTSDADDSLHIIDPCPPAE